MAFGRTIRSYYTCVESSGNGVVQFGFDASHVRIYSESSGPLWINMETSNAGVSGNSFRMSTGDSPLAIEVGTVDTLTYYSTTTAIQFRLWAMG